MTFEATYLGSNGWLIKFKKNFDVLLSSSTTITFPY